MTNKPGRLSVFLVLFSFFSVQSLLAAPVLQQPSTGLQTIQPEITQPRETSDAPVRQQDQTSSDFLAATSALSAPSAASETSPFLGVEEGQTVSGTVEIRPNQDQLPGIKKVAYYLDGMKSGKVYQSPFMWGGISGTGTAGFDTKTISDGNHDLSMTYTDASGDHSILIHFTVDNTNTAPPLERGDPNEAIWGIDNGETVSGSVNIYPNFDRVPADSQVTWTLENRNPVTVIKPPYLFGGASGDGTQSFDTRSIPDGIYRLSMNAQFASGSAGDEIIFRIDNIPDTPPSTAPVSSSERTLGGETFPAGTSLIKVDQAGNLSFLAGLHSLYILNSSNVSDPQMLSAVHFNPDTPILDIAANPAGTGVFVLEQGPLINGEFRSRLWFVDAANPASPVLQLKAELRNAKRLMIYQNPTAGLRLLALYPSQGENFIVDCAASGAGTCTTNFYNLYITPDLVHLYQNWIVSALTGSSLISLNFNDTTGTSTPAPVAFLSGNNNYVFASLKNGTVAVYDINQADTGAAGSGILPVVNTIDPEGNDPVYNFISGNRLAVLDSTGLIEIYDVTNPLSVTKLDSVTIPGVRKIDSDGTNLYAVTDTEFRILGPAASAGGDSRILGVSEGQTVSGVVNIRPNPDQIPGIRKVAYYLNGVKSGKVYQSPFLWGGVSGDGTAGFDTRSLADGNYELSMAYTDAAGDHTLLVHFNVDN